jgi:acetyl esterase/lipase
LRKSHKKSETREMSDISLLLRVPYKTVDGTDIPTDIFVPDRPLQDDSGLTPVIIMFHGGGFMLGQAKMNSKDQINDCMSRGWIVMSVEYRLCPGIDVLEGPMADARDALKWAQIGGLASVLKEAYCERVLPDPKRVMAMGTSAGGHLALSLVRNLNLVVKALTFTHVLLGLGDCEHTVGNS